LIGSENRLGSRSTACGAKDSVHPFTVRAFSSEVDTGSREENASKQESRAGTPTHMRNISSIPQRQLNTTATIVLASYGGTSIPAKAVVKPAAAEGGGLKGQALQ
jgi:hypothetical protein